MSLKNQKLSRFAEPKIRQVSIESVIDWTMIANKFREISGDEEYLDTTSSQEGKDEEEGNEGNAPPPPHSNGASHAAV